MATITTSTAAEMIPTSTSDRWAPCWLATESTPPSAHGGPVNVLAALAALMWIVLGRGGPATSGPRQV